MKNYNYNYNLGLLFEDVAQQHAQKQALVLHDSIMNFSQLSSLSNQIAHMLLSQGVQKNDVVAIFNDKSSMGFCLMLASLKIGAIYVNIDTTSPIQRQERILQKCQPKICFFSNATSCWASNNNSQKYQINLIDYTHDIFFQQVGSFPASLPLVTAEVTGNDPAYLMFTSGSTGFPKGVVISHASLLNFVSWGRETFSVSPDDVFTSINPIYFDNSVFDFYVSLFNGASLVPIDASLASNPRHLVKYVSQKKCTIWFSVPSMLNFCLRMRAITTDDLQSLRIISFGGEGFPKSQLRELYNLIGNRTNLVNVYGPTECTCICSSYYVHEEDLLSQELLPLGRIAPNFSYNIIDETGQPVAKGVKGELQLKGPNVGLGYYCDPDRTEQFFVQDPLSNYLNCTYNTGDIVHCDENGLLWFCGRKDNQIKRMGYRIELEEIEAAFGDIEGVLENACVYSQSAIGESGKIIAFVHAPDCNETSILKNLMGKIPLYMKPDIIEFTDSLPKNANGKIDRKKIKASWEQQCSQ